MSNEVTSRPAAPTPDAFRNQFEKMQGEIASALPPHIPVERFMRVVLTAVNGNPDLIRADRRSLFESAMKAAQDGLLPDGRDGAFVMFGQKVTWMPMISGILKKVRNSGDLLSIAAHVAYDKDEFTYLLGDDEKIEHKPSLSDRGKPMLVYAIAKTKDGGIYREIMTVEAVEKVRAVSKAAKSGPWVSWWDEMARKTVLRRLAKRLPMSSDLDDLIRRDDDLYEFGQDQPKAVASGLKDRLLGAQQPSTTGFQIDHIDRETGEIKEQASIDASEVRAEKPATREAETASVPEITGDPRDRDDTRPEPQETKQSPIQGWTIERARADGEKAKREGRARRGMPGEIRDDQALTAAWQSAWESAEVEAAA